MICTQAHFTTSSFAQKDTITADEEMWIKANIVFALAVPTIPSQDQAESNVHCTAVEAPSNVESDMEQEKNFQEFADGTKRSQILSLRYKVNPSSSLLIDVDDNAAGEDINRITAEEVRQEDHNVLGSFPLKDYERCPELEELEANLETLIAERTQRLWETIPMEPTLISVGHDIVENYLAGALEDIYKIIQFHFPGDCLDSPHLKPEFDDTIGRRVASLFCNAGAVLEGNIWIHGPIPAPLPSEDVHQLEQLQQRDQPQQTEQRHVGLPTRVLPRAVHFPQPIPYVQTRPVERYILAAMANEGQREARNDACLCAIVKDVASWTFQNRDLVCTGAMQALTLARSLGLLG
ncbi:hypothetical protein T439DRAFT_337625 [Meredithblackwellia eburnea MCA 4105]